MTVLDCSYRAFRIKLTSSSVQASQLTVTVLGQQKSVTVRGELLPVSLYPDIFNAIRLESRVLVIAFFLTTPELE